MGRRRRRRREEEEEEEEEEVTAAEEEQEEEEEEEEEEEKAGKEKERKVEEDTPDRETGEKEEKTGQKKPAKRIIFLLLPVLAVMVFAILFFIQKQTGEPGRTTDPKKARRSVVMPVPQSRPVSRKIPTQEPQPEKLQPQALSQKTVEKPSAKPAEKKEAEAASAVPQESAPPSAVAVQNQQNAPAPQKQTSSPPAVKSDKNTINAVKDIRFQKIGGELQMKIVTSGPPGKYTNFALSNPDRLVIDLLGNWEKPPFWEKKVSNSLISRIRLGKHEDKLRIVADFTGNQSISRNFTVSPEGLIVRISTP